MDFFSNSWPKMGVMWQNRGTGCDVDPNELVFTFVGFYVCANFGENRSRNATVIVRTYKLTQIG